MWTSTNEISPLCHLVWVVDLDHDQLDVHTVPGHGLQHGQLGVLDVETEQVHPVQKDRDKGISWL